MNRNIKKNTVTYDMRDSAISYYTLDRNYSCIYKTQHRLRMIFILNGEISYSSDDISLTQDNTEFLLLPSYTSLHLHVIKPTKLMILDIGSKLVKSAFDNVQKKPTFGNALKCTLPFIRVSYTHDLFRSVQAINSDYKENFSDPYIVELSIRKLIYKLMKTEYAEYMFSIKAKHPMEQAVYYIERNIKKSIKINDIADSLNMSGANFTNTFKRHYGVSPHAYIRNHKMNIAKALLKDYTVTDTAFDLGYENVSAFISHFKSVNNITPKQYQIVKYTKNA